MNVANGRSVRHAWGMSENTRNLTLERINRLATAVADLMESHTSHSRLMFRALESMDARLDRMEGRLDGIEKAVKELATEQVLLGNRVENGFSRALRTNIRLDEIESGLGHSS